jgi:GrpB-like predicted nucleotidyltransferase (UPF0157 family)
LHAVKRPSAFWTDHLLFRDYLRSHREAALAYGQLKTQLAAKYGDDREGYTDAKGAFISEALEQARKEVSRGLTNICSRRRPMNGKPSRLKRSR